MSIIFITNSCYEVPNFPDTPSIIFQKVEFHDINAGADSLLISISFTDGNGDLGLSDEHTSNAEYRDVDYVFDSQDSELTPDEVVTPRDVGKEMSSLIGYPSSENISTLGFTTVPPYELPYSCTHWQIKPSIEGIEILDTVLVIPNRNQFNIFVDFLFKDSGQAEFKEFDWIGTEEFDNCGLPIDGRFPVLQSDSNDAAIEGTLKYGFVSAGLIPLFGDKVLKLRIQIQDRALNKSNIVESQEFTLREIQNN